MPSISKLFAAAVVLTAIVILLVAVSTRDGDNQTPENPYVIENHFEGSDDSWRVYEYYDDGIEKKNVHHEPIVHENGGVDDSGYISGDSTMWTEDMPETPHSILAFENYREWYGKESFDFRGKNLHVCFKGDNLDLKGSKVYFWAMVNSTRFHYTRFPLEVGDGEWACNDIKIIDDIHLWHQSWVGKEKGEALGNILNSGKSYGFSLVGFPYGDIPTGTFSMDNFIVQ